MIFDTGPIHWISKRQTLTARSSAEAEIYATDEATKALLAISHLTADLGLTNEFFSVPAIIFNDNNACVCWSHKMTTKGLRHMQMRENAIRESIHDGFIDVKHIPGIINIADIFTKEDKNLQHYLLIRDQMVVEPAQIQLSPNQKKSSEPLFRVSKIR